MSPRTGHPASRGPRSALDFTLVHEVPGRLRIAATQVGADTTTARIARFIQESLGKQSETRRLADRLADQRVSLTLVTGGLVYAVTRDLTRLQAVFLVDYSCALKLGTPVAFKAGTYATASHGILMKGGQAIEQLAAVDTVLHNDSTIGILLNALAGVSQAPGVRGQAAERIRHLMDAVRG